MDNISADEKMKYIIPIIIIMLLCQSNIISEGALLTQDESSGISQNDILKTSTQNDHNFTIIRDEYGVPHIYADTKAALSYAAGYGDQFIVIIPKINMVIVSTAENFVDHRGSVFNMLFDHILHAVKEK